MSQAPVVQMKGQGYVRLDKGGAPSIAGTPFGGNVRLGNHLSTVNLQVPRVVNRAAVVPHGFSILVDADESQLRELAAFDAQTRSAMGFVN